MNKESDADCGCSAYSKFFDLNAAVAVIADYLIMAKRALLRVAAPMVVLPGSRVAVVADIAGFHVRVEIIVVAGFYAFVCLFAYINERPLAAMPRSHLFTADRA